MALPPSRPQASRSSSRSSTQDDDDTHELLPQQAGRSAIHLAAQHSAQSLREASRSAQHIPSRLPSTPNVLRKKNRPSRSHTDSNVQPLSTSKPSPYTPVLSSPLNPTHPESNSFSSSRKSSDGATDVSLHPGREQITHHKSTPAIRVTIPSSLPSEPSDPNSPANASRLRAPKSVREFGSDHTRYFGPRTTRSNSDDDFMRHDSNPYLMAGARGASTADISKRLSDPFEDSKRLSNPFESGDDSASRETSLSDQSPVDDQTAHVARSAVPTRPATPIFVRDADPEKPTFFQFIDDRFGAPGSAFPLMTDQKEDDDDMHMPQWDDDIRLKPKFKDHFTRESVVSTFGLFLMLSGLLFIFVVLPVISYTGTNLLDYYYETPLDEFPSWEPGEPWSHVNDRKYPLLKNVRQGLIDPDTPEDAMTRESIDGDDLVLVFSDEFNSPNRTFYHGDDPYWYAYEGWYGATADIEWYDPDAVNTGGGTLLLQMDEFRNHDLDYRSGMLNSWNQLCFKGGVFEVSMSLPGPAGVHGLWPGVWTMGNLGKPGYLATTDGLWPYTYNECDAGITNNQSDHSGLNFLPGQRLSSCTCENQDHPTPDRGRGAPEIDIAEVSGDWSGFGLGVATQSFQVAPFDVWYYPNYDFMQMPNPNFSMVNSYTGGPYQQAVSTTTMLNNRWYDGKEYQKFAFEYRPGDDENAFISWTVGDEEMMRFDGRAIGPNGNIGQRLISEEPMSLILNLGMSHGWVDVQLAKLRFPAIMRIDYVRLYQREDQEMVTCDPPGYETTEYISKHPKAYRNPNVTRWEQAGYSWPRNALVDGCPA